MSLSVLAKMNLEHPIVDIGHCLRLVKMGEEKEIAHNLVLCSWQASLKEIFPVTIVLVWRRQIATAIDCRRSVYKPREKNILYFLFCLLFSAQTFPPQCHRQSFFLVFQKLSCNTSVLQFCVVLCSVHHMANPFLRSPSIVTNLYKVR